MTASSIPASSSRVESALLYAELGYEVLPVASGKKTPACATWGQTTDSDVIRREFKDGMNVGILAPADVLVLDADDHRTAEQLESHFRELTVAPKHATPNGAHFFLRVPVGWTMPARTQALPGVDVRGLGRAYVVAPDSRVDGREYRVVRPLVPPDLLPMASETLLAALNHKAEHRHRTPGPCPAIGLATTPYGRAAIAGEVAAVARAQPGIRNDRLNAAAFNLGQLFAGGEIASEAEAWVPLSGAAIGAGLPADEVERTIRSGFGAGAVQPRATPGTPSAGLIDAATLLRTTPVGNADDLSPDAQRTLLEAPLTDAGNAERIIALFGLDWIHVPGLGDLVWCGTHWELDTRDSARQWGIPAMRRLRFEADRSDLPRDVSDRIVKHALQGENLARLSAAVTIARGNDRIHVEARTLDTYDDFLNVANGRLDLRSGVLHPHNRNAYETKVAPVRWDPDAEHWAVDELLRLLREDGRERTLQEIAGACLSGRTEKRLWFLVGPSGTGKSTFCGALASVLGPYAQHVEPATLLEALNSAGSPRADLVKLRSARLVIAGELVGRLNHGLLKRMTGGDEISARGPHQRREISFSPAFTLLMHSNQRPRFDGLDDGMLARVAEVPFRTLPSDPQLRVREALTEDPVARAALLTWAVTGARRWYANGCRTHVSESIERSTVDLSREMDPFADWFEERIEAVPNGWTATNSLFEDYLAWSRRVGLREVPSKVALARWIASRAGVQGGDAARRNGTRGYLGIRLRP